MLYLFYQNKKVKKYLSFIAVFITNCFILNTCAFALPAQMLSDSSSIMKNSPASEVLFLPFAIDNKTPILLYDEIAKLLQDGRKTSEEMQKLIKMKKTVEISIQPIMGRIFTLEQVKNRLTQLLSLKDTEDQEFSMNEQWETQFALSTDTNNKSLFTIRMNKDLQYQHPYKEVQKYTTELLVTDSEQKKPEIIIELHPVFLLEESNKLFSMLKPLILAKTNPLYRSNIMLFFEEYFPQISISQPFVDACIEWYVQYVLISFLKQHPESLDLLKAHNLIPQSFTSFLNSDSDIDSSKLLEALTSIEHQSKFLNNGMKELQQLLKNSTTSLNAFISSVEGFLKGRINFDSQDMNLSFLLSNRPQNLYSATDHLEPVLESIPDNKVIVYEYQYLHYLRQTVEALETKSYLLAIENFQTTLLFAQMLGKIGSMEVLKRIGIQIYYQYGIWLKECGCNDLAQESFTQALALCDDSQKLIQLLKRSKNEQEQLLLRTLEVYAYQTKIYYEVKDFKKAKKNTEIIKTLIPDEDMLNKYTSTVRTLYYKHKNAALIYELICNIKRGVKYSEGDINKELAELSREFLDMRDYCLIGEIYEIFNFNLTALKYYYRAIAQSPISSHSWLLASSLYLKLGNNKRAFLCFIRASKCANSPAVFAKATNREITKNTLFAKNYQSLFEWVKTLNDSNEQAILRSHLSVALDPANKDTKIVPSQSDIKKDLTAYTQICEFAPSFIAANVDTQSWNIETWKIKLLQNEITQLRKKYTKIKEAVLCKVVGKYFYANGEYKIRNQYLAQLDTKKTFSNILKKAKQLWPRISQLTEWQRISSIQTMQKQTNNNVVTYRVILTTSYAIFQLEEEHIKKRIPFQLEPVKALLIEDVKIAVTKRNRLLTQEQIHTLIQHCIDKLKSLQKKSMQKKNKKPKLTIESINTSLYSILSTVSSQIQIDREQIEKETHKKPLDYLVEINRTLATYVFAQYIDKKVNGHFMSHYLYHTTIKKVTVISQKEQRLIDLTELEQLIDTIYRKKNKQTQKTKIDKRGKNILQEITDTHIQDLPSVKFGLSKFLFYIEKITERGLGYITFDPISKNAKEVSVGEAINFLKQMHTLYLYGNLKKEKIEVEESEENDRLITDPEIIRKRMKLQNFKREEVTCILTHILVYYHVIGLFPYKKNISLEDVIDNNLLPSKTLEKQIGKSLQSRDLIAFMYNDDNVGLTIRFLTKEEYQLYLVMKGNMTSYTKNISLIQKST